MTLQCLIFVHFVDMSVLLCLTTVFFSVDINCRARLFDLAVSLLPGLDEPALDVLFSAIKPALQVGLTILCYLVIVIMSLV